MESIVERNVPPLCSSKTSIYNLSQPCGSDLFLHRKDHDIPTDARFGALWLSQGREQRRVSILGNFRDDRENVDPWESFVCCYHKNSRFDVWRPYRQFSEPLSCHSGYVTVFRHLRMRVLATPLRISAVWTAVSASSCSFNPLLTETAKMESEHPHGGDITLYPAYRTWQLVSLKRMKWPGRKVRTRVLPRPSLNIFESPREDESYQL